VLDGLGIAGSQQMRRVSVLLGLGEMDPELRWR
jgi:hypothetical protein